MTVYGARKWVDPDDAPRLDRDWFERAEIRQGGRLIRKARPRGRPKSAAPKKAVNIRLDAAMQTATYKTKPSPRRKPGPRIASPVSVSGLLGPGFRRDDGKRGREDDGPRSAGRATVGVAALI